MILIDSLDELETGGHLMIDNATGHPTWYVTAASYLRRFQYDQHSATSDLMPADRRITLACRKLYRISNQEERAVMDGSSDLLVREKSRIFNRLCCRLAIEARLTAAALFPPDQHHIMKGEIKDNESDCKKPRSV